MKSPRIYISVTADKLAEIKKTAKKRGLSLSNYVASELLNWPILKQTGRPKKESKNAK